MNKMFFIVAIIGLSFTSTSCLKRFKKGCTFEDATNYDKKVGQDDGSCTFESKTSFWFKQTKSNSLNNSGVTNLTVFIDEISVGNLNPTEWKVGPDCDGGNFTINNNWIGTNSKYINYLINDQNGTKRFEGDIFLTPASCNNVELK